MKNTTNKSRRPLAVISGIVLAIVAAILAIIFVPTKILVGLALCCANIAFDLAIIYGIIAIVRKRKSKKNAKKTTDTTATTNNTAESETESKEAEATNSETEETVDKAEETPASQVATVCECKEAGAKDKSEALEKRVAKLEESAQEAAAKAEADFEKKCDADPEIKSLRTKIKVLTGKVKTEERVLENSYLKNKAEHQEAVEAAKKELDDANTAYNEASLEAKALGDKMNDVYAETLNLTGNPEATEEAKAAAEAYEKAKAEFDAASKKAQALNKRIEQGVDGKPSLKAVLAAAEAEVAKDNANIADATMNIQGLNKEIDECNSKITARKKELRKA